MKKLKALKNKKGFTLIELLTVIAILGILVLIAAPKFLGYTAQANEAHIKADIKTFENVIDSKLVLDQDQDAIENWPEIGKTELESYRDNGSLFTIEGPVEKDYQFNESYVDIPEEDFKKEFKSELSGNFIMDSGGKIYYHDETLTMGNDKNSSVNDNDEDENTVVDNNDEDENTVNNNDKDENTVVEEPKFTSEGDFKWVAYSDGYSTKEHPTEKGFYKYTGTGKEIVNIPHVIKGTEMTSYSNMFSNGGKDVKKVISTNPKVTNMNAMFALTQATSLDLSKFDTSSVTDMNLMFYQSKATSLDLSNWDTSNVKNMNDMFSQSYATTLDVSKFDTSNVTDMAKMFLESKATSLDLSNWDTSNVKNMNAMFWGSYATTLDVSKFDTSNVTDMSWMFASSLVTTLDLSSFRTSNVTNMSSMFYSSQVTTLDLSSFDTSIVTDMAQMFKDSQTTTGHARSQADADRFNASSMKPSNLKFITN